MAARNGPAHTDKISAAGLYDPVTKRVPPTTVGSLAFADTFAGSGPRAGWSWVVKPAATVDGGVLRFPVQEDADPVGPGNTASLLLRNAGPRRAGCRHAGPDGHLRLLKIYTGGNWKL